MEPTRLRPGECCHRRTYFIEDGVNHAGGVAGTRILHQSVDDSLNAIVNDSYGLLVRAHMVCRNFSTTAHGEQVSPGSIVDRVRGLGDHPAVSRVRRTMLVIGIISAFVVVVALSVTVPRLAWAFSIFGIGISIAACWAFDRARTQGEMMKP